jgi:putative endonuclease
MPFVYILCCGDGSFYTGAALDPQKRLAQHQAGTASRYTRAHLPVHLVWQRRVRTWGRALSEEHRIKALRRAEKLALVRSGSVRATQARRIGQSQAP